MKRCFALLAFLLLSLGLSAAEDLQLVQVVLLSRHGVRSPTKTSPPLEDVAKDAWPKWPVGPGELTPHGVQAATAMGEFYRYYFSQAGVLGSNGCPRTHEVFVWSDVEERTVKTAQSILDGMYNGCGLKPRTQANRKEDDPLFHPDTGGVCKPDGATVRNAIIGRIGNHPDALMEAYAEPFARLQNVLGCCAPKVCAPSTAATCKLQDVPNTITPEGKLKGPISIASTLTEVFLLEFADGMPEDQVGWGRVDEPTLRELLQLHELRYDLAERTFYPAQQAGSNLLDQVLSTLRARVTGKAAKTNRAPAGAKFVLFAGHDTNIANLGGMLNIDWALDGYQPNATPPDGALAFELFLGKSSGKYYVELFYFAQSPGQLRYASKLTPDRPASVAPIVLPGCVATATKAGAGFACPWAEFERIVSATIDRRCVGSGKQSPLREPPM